MTLRIRPGGRISGGSRCSSLVRGLRPVCRVVLGAPVFGRVLRGKEGVTMRLEGSEMPHLVVLAPESVRGRRILLDRDYLWSGVSWPVMCGSTTRT